MSNFGDRLKSERKRLKLTQDEFAALGGVKKGAQFNYENGTRMPDAAFLVAIYGAGVDTHYVLHGEPRGDSLSDDENELIIGYRKLDVRGKARALGVIEGINDAVPTPTSSRTNNISVHGNVKKQVVGDIAGSALVKNAVKKKS